ncbi:hypothetical protein [Piscinibacter sp. XHJ-5]|uniref:hypothetical protein n=1 Tax=Piscinibacter sp. XHJ-5 TaxID=3037797 RepID=UPI0024529C61|nr:hypothetical protein [Piscinibacter sp. XHJ-5]
MLEALFEILGEFFLQAVAELLFEIGLHSLAEPFRREPNPWLAAMGYALLGAIVGGISLLVFPAHLVAAKPWRIVNMLVTPIGVGLLMCFIGAWRARRGQALFRIDRFAYGYLFALALALVRLWFAQ